MWKVAEVQFLQVGQDRATKEGAAEEARRFSRKANFFSPEEEQRPSYIVLIGPNGEIELPEPKVMKRGLWKRITTALRLRTT